MDDEYILTIPPMPKLSLAQILEAFSALDDVEGMDFDPAVLAEDLRDKVDAIYTAHDRLCVEASRLEGHAEDFALAAKRAYAAADRLKSYVQWNMEQQKFQRIPGDKFCFEIRENNPSVYTEHNPTAEDFLKHEDVICRTVLYAWDKTTIRNQIKAGKEFPFAKLKPSKRVVFDKRKEKK